MEDIEDILTTDEWTMRKMAQASQGNINYANELNFDYDSTIFNIAGYWSFSSKEFVLSQLYTCTDFLKCKNATKVNFTSRFVAGSYLAEFFDIDKNTISAVQATTADITDYSLDIPENTHYLIINGYSDTESSYTVNIIYENKTYTKEGIELLYRDKTIDTERFLNKGFWSVDTFSAGPDGTDYYRSTGKLFCKDIGVLKYTNSFPSNTECIIFYDKQGDYISGLKNNTSVLETNTINIPATAYTLAINTNKVDVLQSNAQMLIDNPLSYTYEYQSYYESKKEAESEDTNVITVDVNGGGDYTQISHALSSINDSDTNRITIIVNPGTYERFSMVDNMAEVRYVSIIGVNKKECIILDNTGEYATPPAEISTVGVIENLTFIATHDDFASDQEYYDYLATLSGANVVGSYAVHSDGYNYEQDVEFNNCVFISYNTAALGIGFHENETIKFKNCLAETRAPLATNAPAITAHSKAGGGTALNQRLILDGCKVRAINTNRALSAYFVVQGDDMTIASYNTLYYCASGIVVENEIPLTPDSFGNNSTDMNA